MAVIEAQGSPPPGRRGTGWLSFAALLLVISGVFKIFDSLWAFKYNRAVSPDVQTILFEHDLRSWGFVWLIVGIVLIGAGLVVMTGAEWARWVGVVAAGIAVVTFLPWIYYQPLWTVLSVGLAILAIYALAAFGGRQAAESWAADSRIPEAGSGS